VAAVDVEGRAGDLGVGHEVDGQGGERTDRPDGMDAVRYASVDTATRRLTVIRADTGRDKRETARLAENSQLAGRFRR
jgi:hypothetical protein